MVVLAVERFRATRLDKHIPFLARGQHHHQPDKGNKGTRLPLPRAVWTPSCSPLLPAGSTVEIQLRFVVSSPPPVRRFFLGPSPTTSRRSKSTRCGSCWSRHCQLSPLLCTVPPAIFDDHGKEKRPPLSLTSIVSSSANPPEALETPSLLAPDESQPRPVDLTNSTSSRIRAAASRASVLARPAQS